MTEVHCFTSASFAYLDRVRVLAETLRRFHPQWRLWLCQVDRPPPGLTFDPDREGLAGVVDVTALGAVGAVPSLFTHDVVELCTAVKGEMLCHLLSQGAQKVFYIDPDIAVLESLTELEILLDRHDVILTPHQVEPDEDPHAIADNELGSLKHGVYNLGFLGVAATSDGWRFARWWRSRLLEYCYDDIASGLFTDQRWCDLAPAFFGGLHILRDPGYNVASWNLSRRPISIHQDGRITAAGHLLRFFHFTKINSAGEMMLERYSGGSIEVFELMEWYRRRLTANAVIGLPDQWYAFGRYHSGELIPRAHRRLYRDQRELQARYPDPFSAGPAAFANLP
jgi:hypothetical protein